MSQARMQMPGTGLSKVIIERNDRQMPDTRSSRLSVHLVLGHAGL